VLATSEAWIVAMNERGELMFTGAFRTMHDTVSDFGIAPTVRISRVWALIAIVAMASTACASNRSSAAVASQEVLSTDDARIKARTSGDVETLARIYASDYTLITAEGVVRTKDDQINELRSGQLQFQPVETLERTVRLFDGAAIVPSHERSVIMRNGQNIGGEFRVTRVYVKRDGRWVLVVTHATRISS
jgi:uncharacterized protein (TIGR02246 family)